MYSLHTICPVQRQAGTCDCGLFALAFATSLCNGICPTAMVYNQQSMRKHFLQCLVNGKMTEFPGRKRKPRTKKSAIIPVHVFYKCRQPECGEMAECDQCHEWFHKKCESIPATTEIKHGIARSECCSH